MLKHEQNSFNLKLFVRHYVYNNTYFENIIQKMDIKVKKRKGKHRNRTKIAKITIA